MFGVDTARVRQLVNQNMRKMQRPERADNLRPYMNENYAAYEINDEYNQLPLDW